MPGYKPACGTVVSWGLICRFCQRILRAAVQTAEGNRLCESCYVYEQSKLSNPKVVAVEPKCNKDKAARREVDPLIIQCDYAAKGCTWIGQVTEFEQHHLLTCQYCPVLCHNCGTTVRPYQQHESICPMRPVTCHYCGREVQLCNYGLHLEVCLYYSKGNMHYSTGPNDKNPFEAHQIHPFQSPYGPPISSSVQIIPLVAPADPVEASGLWPSSLGHASAGDIAAVHTWPQPVQQDILMQQRYKSTAAGVASTNT